MPKQSNFKAIRAHKLYNGRNLLISRKVGDGRDKANTSTFNSYKFLLIDENYAHTTLKTYKY